jgi:biotin carboxyl carrier protein
VQRAQKQVQHDEDTLAVDEKALDGAVTALLPALSQVSAPHQTSGSPTRTAGSTGAAHPSGSTGSTGSSTNSGSSGASTVVTAAQLASDQKQIDAANAQLEVANQNRAAAVLSAPITGTVAALSIAPGASVQAGDSSASITVIGAGVKAVTTTVGINDVDLVKRGDPAQVTVDGVSSPLPGRVSYVGVMNTPGTSGSTATYPVTVVLNPTSTPLFDGAGVSTAITVGTVRDVLTVPTSALHRAGALATVSVYANGKVSVQRVNVGIAGFDRVQVTTGLSAGQRVVLADISAPIPSNTSLTGRRFGGAGGLGGGGLGGGAAVLGGTGRVAGR